jgi:enoyl-CoA hydratase/carnithine racemase
VSAVLEVEAPSPGVALLRLNRPERLNALNHELVGALEEACSYLGEDAATRAVVLTGAGRGFCSGLDVRDFGPGLPGATAAVAEQMRFQERMGSLPVRLRSLPQPVVAAVNGACVGGGFALCLGADVRLCSTAATFANAAILLGLSGAEMGMSYHLPRIVGTTVAADWMLSGRLVSAEEADRRGLVSQLVEPEHLVERAVELAAQIAEHPPFAVEMTKRALQVNTDAPDIEAALAVENRTQVLTFVTDESVERRENWQSGRHPTSAPHLPR